MIGLLGKKVGMTQVFEEDGTQKAVTLLEVGPCYVTSIKNAEKDGYSAVQLAYDPIKEARLSRAELGHLSKAKLPALKMVREIRTQETEGLEIGAQIGADSFKVGDFVDVEGVSIGRGFQGVVKRHHFKGGEAAHGAKFGRESGSIGQGSAFPSRVPKGRRMAGQLGNAQVTVQNLKIVEVDAENQVIAVKGAVPGVEGGYLVIKAALKKASSTKWKVQSSKTAPEKKETAAETSKKQVEVPADPEKAEAEEAPKAATKEAPKAGSKEAPEKKEQPKNPDSKSKS